jgi:hypothetical protein
VPCVEEGKFLKREIRSFSDIVSETRAAQEWLVAHKVKFDKTRFDRYFRDADNLERVWQVDGGSELIDNRGIYPLLTSLSEADEVGKIYRFLSGDPGNETELIRKLKICLKGPELLSDENPATGSNQARDVFFELVLAAKCVRAGLRPILGEAPDIKLRFGDFHLHMECKRLGSPIALRSAARKAVRQLDSTLSSDRSGLGIIAFEVSKFAGLPDYYIAQDLVEIDELLNSGRREVRQHESLLYPSLTNIKNQRIVGVIFYMSTFAFNQASGSWGTRYSLETVRISEHTPAGTEEALRAFTTRLHQAS